jgi:Cdc6-like AAA superfamily ATPase
MSNTYPSAIKDDIKATRQLIQDTLTKRKQVKETLQLISKNLVSLEKKLRRKTNGVLGRLFSSDNERAQLNQQLEEVRQQLAGKTTELSLLAVDITPFQSHVTDDQYIAFIEAAGRIEQAQKKWQVTSSVPNTEARSSVRHTVTKSEIDIFVTELELIHSDYKAICFKNITGPVLFVYPGVGIWFTANDQVNILSSAELGFFFLPQRFITSSVPSDSEVIDRVWDKVNKDGGPDLRYRDNFQTPVARYASLEFTLPGSGEFNYYISNFQAGEAFAEAFSLMTTGIDLFKPLPSTPKPSSMTTAFTQPYYNVLKDFNTELHVFSGKLQNDTGLIHSITIQFGEYPDDKAVAGILIYDFCQATQMLNSKEYKSSDLETAGLGFVCSGLLGTNLIEKGYDYLASLYKAGEHTDFIKHLYNIGQKGNPLPHNHSSPFGLLVYLKETNHPLFDEYAGMIYRLVNILAKADGRISKDEEANLKKIYQLTHHPVPVADVKPANTVNPSQSLEEIVAELEEMIGLDEVKAEVKTLVNFIRVQKTREASGLKTSGLSYHVVFTGNPGTGKTTVARIVAKLYKALGILEQGHLVETDRSGLIADYIGQTATKVNKVVDSALNGVLFIDEAYALAGKSNNDYGNEAIATLIKRIEDDRHRLVVIMAGYTDEMKVFIDTNPGFQSRFNRYISFRDYTPEELFAIFELYCRRSEYSIDEAARAQLKKIFEQAWNNRTESFGNGRLVRNIFEKTLENQANRIAGIGTLTTEILTTITAADITEKHQ